MGTIKEAVQYRQQHKSHVTVSNEWRAHSVSSTGMCTGCPARLDAGAGGIN